MRTSHALMGVALAVALAAGCRQGEGKRCQVDSDCEDGLSCYTQLSESAIPEGTCQRPSAAVDAAANDTGTADAAQADAAQADSSQADAGQEDAGQEAASQADGALQDGAPNDVDQQADSSASDVILPQEDSGTSD
jgi:hypothetical protein